MDLFGKICFCELLHKAWNMSIVLKGRTAFVFGMSAYIHIYEWVCHVWFWLTKRRTIESEKRNNENERAMSISYMRRLITSMDMYLKENLSKLTAARNKGNKEQRTRTSVERMTKTKQKLMRIDYADHACAQLHIITAFFSGDGHSVVQSVHTLILIHCHSHFFFFFALSYTKRKRKNKWGIIAVVFHCCNITFIMFAKQFNEYAKHKLCRQLQRLNRTQFFTGKNSLCKST